MKAETTRPAASGGGGMAGRRHVLRCEAEEIRRDLRQLPEVREARPS